MSAVLEHKVDMLTGEVRALQQLVQELIFANSPAALSVDEKARILTAARPKGKAAMREAMKIINGQSNPGGRP